MSQNQGYGVFLGGGMYKNPAYRTSVVTLEKADADIMKQASGDCEDDGLYEYIT